MPDTDSYKPELIDNSEPSLDRTGDFSGIQKPEFFAGVTASGDVTFRLSAAAEFGVRFADMWEIDPAAAAVVGEVSLTTKFAAGISTTGSCPFTYGLDVGARLFARATAPKVFGWAGGEVDLTDKWKKTIIKGGTCPELGPIPYRRSLRGRDHLLVEGRAEGEDVIRNMSRLEAAEPGAHSVLDGVESRHISGGHMPSLGKGGVVYGPAFSIPAGEFFCPSRDGEEGMTCEQAYGALEASNEGDGWRDATKHKREELTPTSTIDENAIAAQFYAYQQRSRGLGHHAGGEVLHMFDKRANDKEKLIKACKQSCDISEDFPPGGQLNGEDWGWVNPKDCGNFDFGSPLTARAGVEYHTEHILEAQMIDLFFQHLDKKKSNLPDPKQNAAQGATVSFCDYVDALWDVPPFVWPGQDTTGGVGKAWNPIMHIAAQYPTKTFKRSEFVALESSINTPTKTSAWRSGNPWATVSWTNDHSDYANARVILQKMRSTMGSRIYQSHSTIRTTMKTQTERIGKVLDALDSTLLPANQRVGYNK